MKPGEIYWVDVVNSDCEPNSLQILPLVFKGPDEFIDCHRHLGSRRDRGGIPYLMRETGQHASPRLTN